VNTLADFVAAGALSCGLAMGALADQLKSCGVVGAGGAGFPLRSKRKAKWNIFSQRGRVRAAASQGLRADEALRSRHGGRHQADAIRHQGAPRTIWNQEQERRCGSGRQSMSRRHDMDIVQLGDFYPSGDEYELVYTGTGRLIPPGGIPLAVGCVVSNVESLYNVARAADGNRLRISSFPSTERCAIPSHSGRRPGQLSRSARLRGGATVPDFGFFVGGIMMGTLSFDLDDVVTKTTCGLIFLPRDHYLIKRKERPQTSMRRIGKSACDHAATVRVLPALSAGL